MEGNNTRAPNKPFASWGGRSGLPVHYLRRSPIISGRNLGPHSLSVATFWQSVGHIMNRTKTAIVLPLLLLGTASIKSADENMIVLVGRHLSAVEITPEEFCPEDDCISFYGVIDGIYEVKQVIRGTFDADTVSFRQYWHYGLPSYYRHQFALLFLEKTEDGIVGLKHSGIHVQQTRKGDFYWCPEPKIASEWEALLIPVNFAPPVEIDLRYLNQREIDTILASPFYERSRSVARCVGGVPLGLIADQTLEHYGRK